MSRESRPFGGDVSMRRLRFAFLLLLPCLSGCIFGMEECRYDSKKAFELECAKTNPTTVAYSEAK
jgi:hypothetical protein